MVSKRWLILAGALINIVALGGWVLAKTSGIPFIDGLDVSERVQFADGLSAAFALVAVVAAILAATVWRAAVPGFGPLAFAFTAIVTAVLTGFGMVAAGSHVHSHGGAAGAAHTHAAGTPAHVDAVVPPKAYDPTKPIDLSGVPGVTPEQQARAENLIAITLVRLPQWNDMNKVIKAGFVSIGDGFTGTEHYVNQAYFDDGRILDPDYPESLVYDTNGPGPKKLAAAMYMLGSKQTLADVPDVGGKLTQWHIHNNLCFTTDGKVRGITDAAGKCTAPLVRGVQAPMIHVWIRAHECGPFAALEGVGGGQIKAGETKLCDHAHGAPTPTS